MPRRHCLKPLFVGVLSLALLAGCGYPTVSPTTYELSKALYSACNRRDETHLDRVAELVATHLESGEISEREAGWLNGAVATARDGDWKTAAATARQIMVDQVEY